MLEPSEEELSRWVLEALSSLRGALSDEAIQKSWVATSATPPRHDEMFQEAPLPGGFPEIMRMLAGALRNSVPTTSPGFMAYVPGGGIPSAAVGGFLANMLNRFTGVEDQAPGLVKLETQVIHWFCKEFGLPETSFGILTSGGSIANLTALMAARVRAFGDAGDFSKARLYVSDQVHHSVQKAAFLAGIPRKNCISISTDDDFRLKMDVLSERIQLDRRHGFVPFCVVGSAGTTNTGAIDPLLELGVFCQRENIWFHVDGAYGGAFVLCEAGKKRLEGIELADSITFDPHKSLFLPYGTGCLLVRQREDLYRMAHYQADYLTVVEENSAASLGLELSRDYRGIRLWLPFMLHGVGAFRQALAEKLELTHWLYSELHALGFEMLCKPQLTTIVLKPGGISRRVNALGRVYLAPTKLRGEEVTRVCILSFKTHFEQVQYALEDIAYAKMAIGS